MSAGPVYPTRDRRWDFQAFNCGPFYDGYLATMGDGRRVIAWARLGGRRYSKEQRAFLGLFGYAPKTKLLSRPDADHMALKAAAAQAANRRAYARENA